MSVRIGFVGAGGIANAHLRNLEQIPEAKLVAFADVDAARAKAAAERFQATAYTDYHEMLDKEALDAVYVCVPPFAHYDAEILAAKKGLALFVEKPVAVTLAKAKEIARAIADAGVLSAVGYHWRYYDITDRAREILSGRSIGMMMGYWLGGMPGVPWWRVMEQSGGQMVEQTTHIFDLARYLCGEVDSVYAQYATRALQDVPNFSVSDVGTATLHFHNGAVGQMATSCMLKKGGKVGLQVIAEDVMLEFFGGQLTITAADKEQPEVIPSAINPSLREDQTFIAAVQSGDPAGIRSPYADALKTLAVTLACNESARSGKTIALD
ncbi:MAG TPA: Gfo/Idh/MocA family oxidoreductase [Armatimonadota bacterium]|nr:Gfo/Idh/MocA family oxidoreductase [Armatimonadota bacterium]